MTESTKNKLIMCVGKLKGIFSLLEFDDDEADITGKVEDILNDMEMLLYGVDDPPLFLKGGGGDDV